MTVGETIKKRRIAIGMSQRALASMVLKPDGYGISPQFMNCIENNRRSCVDYIPSIAKALHVPEEVLYFYSGVIPPKYIQDTWISDDTITMAWSAFDSKITER